MAKFNIGDKVKCTFPDHASTGKVGTIGKLPASNKDYRIDFDTRLNNGKNLVYLPAKYLEAVDDNKINVGDRVKYTHFNHIGKVTYITADRNSAVVLWDDRIGQYDNVKGTEQIHSLRALTKLSVTPELPTDVNPHYNGAVKASDIKPGFKFRIANTNTNDLENSYWEVDSESTYDENANQWQAKFKSFNGNSRATTVALSFFGIIPSSDGSWSSRFLPIPDTPEALVAYHNAKVK